MINGFCVLTEICVEINKAILSMKGTYKKEKSERVSKVYVRSRICREDIITVCVVIKFVSLRTFTVSNT